MDIHFFDPDTGFVTGSRYEIFTPGSAGMIWYTTDGGQNFTEVAVSMGNFKHVWKIYFLDRMYGYGNMSDYNNGDKAYFKTSDGGLTWSEVVYTSSSTYEGLGIGFFNEKLGWVGGDDVSFVTTDGGATFNFIQIDPTYDDNINRFLRVNDSVLFAIGSRIYKYTDINVGEATTPQVDNTLCKISCNPNPISGTSEITYTVPEDGLVVLAITSIGGRQIELLVNKEQKAGEYTITYNPSYK
ncbi:MAG: hypothetical protein IH948_08075, partial [Bacteroidetes bacterium]|nr:hypothetical protein [Bacteroidota bacterium]